MGMIDFLSNTMVEIYESYKSGSPMPETGIATCPECLAPWDVKNCWCTNPNCKLKEGGLNE